MKKILAIGPHPDDIELGCFGSLCRYAEEGCEVHLLIMTKWEGGIYTWDRTKEAEQSASLFLNTLHIEDLRDRYISEGVETISIMEKYINQIQPDIVFIPSANDTHQDHRAVYRAAVVATRYIREVYIYQSPSTTTDFKPTVYVDITDYIDKKIEAVRVHTSQSAKIYMADRVVRWLAEYRAFDILQGEKFFEAFELLRHIR